MPNPDSKKEDPADNDLGLPSLEWPTLEESAESVPPVLAARREPDDLAACLTTIRQNHPHIGRALDALWGFAECEAYLQRLIQDGGDGHDQTRRGFSDASLQALMTILEKHRVKKP